MNILVISNMFPNKNFLTNGIFVKEQVESLLTLGVNSTIIAPIPYVFPFLKLLNKKWENYNNISFEEDFNGIKVYHPRFIAIPRGILKQYWYISLILSSKNLIKKLHSDNKYDLIHIHGSAPDDYAGMKISHLLKIPYILTIHGDSVLALANNKRRFKNTKIALEKANAVIAVSSKIENKIYKLTNRKNNVFVIHNGYSKVKDLLITKVNDSKFIKILFVGNLIPQKGCKNLILAIKKIISHFNNIKVEIVGDGIEAPSLKKLVRELNLTKVINFNGIQPHEKVLEFMQTCDIFIMPSIREAFGVVYLEAMSFKKPIIGTYGEGISDIIIDGENGLLVKPENIDSIVEKLEILLNSKNKRIEIGLNGYNTIKELTWRNNAKKNIEIYKSLTNKRDN